MKKYLLAAVAAAAVTASPAMARDGSAYFGVEGGIVIDADAEFDLEYDTYDYDDAFEIDFKRGVDLDLIAGYDFGMVRAEAELGYKRMKANDLEFDEEFFLYDYDVDIDGKARIWSFMGNLLLDFGDDAGWGAYVGGGFGRANVKMLGDSDSAWAWQLIAGVRTAVSDNIDLGLKYRFFQTGKLSFEDEFDTGEGLVDIGADGKLRSHSLLASLIFNFGGAEAPPPPPPPPPPMAPPPPPPPATQTCPDGTVILATDACPPPPPPPPPPPEPERG